MAIIKYYAPIRATVGKESETVKADSVAEVLSYLRKTYGKQAYKEAVSALIVVNDVSIGLYQGKKTRLTDADVVGFLPLCGGG